MPETPSEKREANEKIPKPGGKLQKYKWWLIGGLAVVAVVVFWVVNHQQASSGASQAGGTGTPSGIDPNTGVPYAQELGAGMGGAGGFFGFGGGNGGGATGPAGPPGTRGKRGRPGQRGPRGHRGHRGHRGSNHRRGHRHAGSRTEALQIAAQSRADWNTRVFPQSVRVGRPMINGTTGAGRYG